MKNLKARLSAIYDILLTTYGEQVCFLEHSDPFELLVATILSAQCTDKKVNSITPKLFKRYTSAADFSKADVHELEKLIHACGFYHAKAANIIGTSKKIVQDFGGKVPETMEELCTLPGVGRKTANVVLGNAFGVPGFPVDTHVKRITNLLGVVNSDDPEKIEEQLCTNMRPEIWSQFSHLFVAHGRARCPARRPDCQHCEIAKYCNYANKVKK